MSERRREMPEIPGVPETEREPFVAVLFEWTGAFLRALVFLVLVFTFLARIIGVDGSSMRPTLHDKDYMLLTGALFYTPRQGDIVVVRKEEYRSEPIVKRVIAVAGQTVDIDFTAGVVYVDGAALDEPYVNAPTNLRYDVLFPVTVDEGCVFLLGDNRNDSTDSRFSHVGMVDTRLVLGKARLVFFPFANLGMVG